MLDIGTAKFDRCVITQGITEPIPQTISDIRTRAIEIVNVFEMEFGW